MQGKTQGGSLSKVILLLVVLLFVIIGLIVYKVFSGEKMPDYQVESGEQLSEDQISDLLGRVGRLIQLPDEQNPLIAMINDAEALRAEQEFYRDAENGDQLIIFAERAMAIIYRPSADILVNVGPIFFDNAQQPAVGSIIQEQQAPDAVAPAPQPAAAAEATAQ